MSTAATSPRAALGAAVAGHEPPRLDVVIPAHDEARVLRASVEGLLAQLRRRRDRSFRITIVDSASSDATLVVARGLAREHDCVRVLHLDEPGRGRALRAAWATSDAEVLAYMDADLATDLAALEPL